MLRTSVFAGLLLLSLGNAANAADDDPKCQLVSIGAANNATSIAGELSSLKGVTVKAIGSNNVLACAPANVLTGIVQAIMALAGHAEPIDTEQHSAKLFFNRDAPNLATALNNIFPGVPVKALGNDTLLFATGDPAQEKNIHEIRRWISILDSPRPEVSLNIWSVQLTSRKPDELTGPAGDIRLTISRFNQELQLALERAWLWLGVRKQEEGFLDPVFSGYIGAPYNAKADGYSLGFRRAFDPLQPSLTHMLGVLSGAKQSQAAYGFADALEGQHSEGSVPDCEAADSTVPEGWTAPRFQCFRQQLEASLRPQRKALLRRAMADYLFQYKLSSDDPHSFSPYDFSHGAQALDSQLDPLLVAFNRDVGAYLRRLQDAVSKPMRKNSGVTFFSNGIVNIRTLAGLQAEVDSTTQNSFPTTPPPLVQDFIKQFGIASAAGGTPQLLKSNLEGNAATALAAFLNSGKPSTVSIGRALNLKINPVSLPGAGAAELNLHMEVKDDGTPQTINPDGSTKNETTDRVSSQLVDTNVRVESLRLFEVSSFSASMSRGREPIPLLPPFVDLPYIGSLVKLKLSPSQTYHRTFAIVSAVVVPTAADMLNGLRFERGKYETDIRDQPRQSDADAGGIRQAHQNKLVCIVVEANPAAAKKDDIEACSGAK
jgi:hypothetical protein